MCCLSILSQLKPPRPSCCLPQVMHATGTSRSEAIEALRYALGKPAEAVKALLSRVPIHHEALNDLLAEYVMLRGLASQYAEAYPEDLASRQDGGSTSSGGGHQSHPASRNGNDGNCDDGQEAACCRGNGCGMQMDGVGADASAAAAHQPPGGSDVAMSDAPPDAPCPCAPGDQPLTGPPAGVLQNQEVGNATGARNTTTPPRSSPRTLPAFSAFSSPPTTTAAAGHRSDGVKRVISCDLHSEAQRGDHRSRSDSKSPPYKMARRQVPEAGSNGDGRGAGSGPPSACGSPQNKDSAIIEPCPEVKAAVLAVPESIGAAAVTAATVERTCGPAAAPCAAADPSSLALRVMRAVLGSSCSLEEKVADPRASAVQRIQSLAAGHDWPGVEALVKQLDAKLFEEYPNLLHWARRCQYELLISRGECAKALQYSRSEIAPLAERHPFIKEAFKDTMTAFVKPVHEIYTAPHRNRLVQVLQQHLLQRLQLPEARFVRLMECLVASHTAWYKLQRCKDPFLADFPQIEALKRPQPEGGAAAPASTLTAGLSRISIGPGAEHRRSEGGGGAAGAGAGHVIPPPFGLPPAVFSSEGGDDSYDSEDEDGEGDDQDEYDEGAVLQIMDVLEVPRSAAIELLISHGGDPAAAIVSVLS